MKSIVGMDGGTINASTIQYFILQNIGDEPITDIEMSILTTINGFTPTQTTPNEDFVVGSNFEVAEGYSLNPNTLTNFTLYPVEEMSIVPLIGIVISNGTSISNTVGYPSTLDITNDSTYIVIKGKTKDADDNDVPVQININFTTLIMVADWEIIDTKGTESTTDDTVQPYVFDPNTMNYNTGALFHDHAYKLKNIGNADILLKDGADSLNNIVLKKGDTYTILSTGRYSIDTYKNLINSNIVTYDKYVGVISTGHNLININ